MSGDTPPMDMFLLTYTYSIRVSGELAGPLTHASLLARGYQLSQCANRGDQFIPTLIGGTVFVGQLL